MGYYLIVSVCAYNFLQIGITTYDPRKNRKILSISSKTKTATKGLFHYYMDAWNKLKLEVTNSESIQVLKRSITRSR